jgi:hypothetical protein
MKKGLLICLFLTFAALPVKGGGRLTMNVSPAYSFAPSFLRIRVRIEPSAENRFLDVVAESTEFYRRSQIQLDGDHAPKTIVVEFPSVPEGDYEIAGIVTDRTGHQSAARESARVMGMGIGR